MTNENPLLNNLDLPKFDLIEPQHVIAALEDILRQSETQMEKIAESFKATWSGLLAPLEEIDRRLDAVWGPVGHLLGVKNSPELRAAYDEVQGKVVEFGLKLSQNRKIYNGLTAIRDNKEEWQRLSCGEKRAIEIRIMSARLSGIELEGDAKSRFNEISKELSQKSTQFTNNLLDSTKSFCLTLTDKNDVRDMPASFLSMASQSFNNWQKTEEPESNPTNGPWRVTLDGPSFLPFMQHCRKRELREQVYKEYITRASSGTLDNTPLITRILTLRQEMAHLLGFNTYAELSLAKKMAQTVVNVDKLAQELLDASYKMGLKEHKDLEKFARKSGFEEPLKQWDVMFYAERMQEDLFDFTDEELRPYFPLPKVLKGLFSLIEKLFGIRIAEANGKAPLWNKDVQFFDLFDSETNQHIASFYLDPYSRPEDKRGGAWMDVCIPRGKLDNNPKLPVAYLVMNGTPPVGTKPSLLTFSDVTTLFHEFGHGLQHMLTAIETLDVTGINGIEWDAVEIPSHFMENWCYHKETLRGLTSHLETGDHLPEDLVDKICLSRTYRSASIMLRQLQFGMIDMELHHRFNPETDDIFALSYRIGEKTSILKPLSEDRFLCSFSHIFAGGYAAGYYSYKWAEVHSADAFSAFEEVGLEKSEAIMETGRRFKETILSLGGSVHPKEVYKMFRGREPTIDALLRHSGLTHINA